MMMKECLDFSNFLIVGVNSNKWLIDKKGNFYVIEINTVPGMTSHSNVPKSGSLLGLTYNEVVQKIINASL
jgi:D-alanine-D-alanine ligase-like ATP-grasp enzyme